MSYCDIHFLSETLSQNVSASVFLPERGPFGSDAVPPYRTVYFLPGYSGNSVSLYTMLSFRRQAELKGLAIVIPNGCNSFYIDHPERNASYSRFIGEELVARTREMFRLSDRREDTYIAGISMGGYGALLNGLRHGDTFSKVAAFSPAALPELLLADPELCEPAGFGIGEFANLFGTLEEYHRGPWDLAHIYPEAAGSDRMPELFIGCGDHDIAVDNMVKQFTRCLKDADIPFTFWECFGNHDVDTWEEMMDPAFSFLAGVPAGTRNSLRLPDLATQEEAIHGKRT